MNGRALDREMWAAVEAVRLPHIRRMEALGVPLSAIAQLGAELPPFGVSCVRWLPGGLYEPDPGGEPAAIMPVPGPDEAELGELGLIDLLAFPTSQPSRWSWRVGTAWMLGEWWLGQLDELTVVETPVRWLARAGLAACILDWDAPVSRWAELRSTPTLRFENETLRARAERAMRRAVTLPQMEVLNVA